MCGLDRARLFHLLQGGYDTRGAACLHVRGCPVACVSVVACRFGSFRFLLRETCLRAHGACTAAAPAHATASQCPPGIWDRSMPPLREDRVHVHARLDALSRSMPTCRGCVSLPCGGVMGRGHGWFGRCGELCWHGDWRRYIPRDVSSARRAALLDRFHVCRCACAPVSPHAPRAQTMDRACRPSARPGVHPSKVHRGCVC
jgi:hypothetical protein